ncbi:hypothetical protein R1flu_028666 [Riccia fluitans]|uniref:Exocyst complex component Sec3 PIP2-binding N-terminal domain-containing protein n=1 Tax=Riccia fluitans TaxID=41844 RepID=A0ABD1XRE3_9MARC
MGTLKRLYVGLIAKGLFWSLFKVKPRQLLAEDCGELRITVSIPHLAAPKNCTRKGQVIVMTGGAARSYCVNPFFCLGIWSEAENLRSRLLWFGSALIDSDPEDVGEGSEGKEFGRRLLLVKGILDFDQVWNKILSEKGTMVAPQQRSDDTELMKLVEHHFRSADSAVVMACRVARTQASSWPGHRRQKSTTKMCILALTASRSSRTQKFKVKFQVLNQLPNNELEVTKAYKLKNLSRVEAVPNDKSGCTFVLGFDSLKAQAVSPPQWTVRNLDDRNRLVTCILKLCKEHIGRLPRIVGMDVVEMALWAQANAKALPIDSPAEPALQDTPQGEKSREITVEREMVSKAEEEDMEALLGTYFMGIDEAEAFSERLKRELTALEAANIHAILESEPLVEEVIQQLDAAIISVEDMDEWLGIFNVKMTHAREDLAAIESKNNRLQVQVEELDKLAEEVDRLLERLRVPPEYASLLTTGSFEEASMPQNVEACDWLVQALRGLERDVLDSEYVNMRAVREKRAELEKLRTTVVRRSSDFLKTYFSKVVDFMISDKTYFSQKGQLKRPDHADLRFKCRSYARLLQHLKNLDKNSLGPLRKAYCSSINLLLRREAREFANELRASAKITRSSSTWSLEGSTSGSSATSSTDTTNAADTYAKMLRIFIPILKDESRFFASFMCFDVLPSAPTGPGGDYDDDDEDISPMAEDGTDLKPAQQNPAELEALDESLQDLLAGVEEDFYAVVDWVYSSDRLRCITMMGVTELYLSSHKGDATSFVRRLLGDLQSRISMQFNRFVEEAYLEIEKAERSNRQAGVLSYFHRFAKLAQRMEDLLTDLEEFPKVTSRELIDKAYKKLIEKMFSVLETVAQRSEDPRYNKDVILLENYAAFQSYMWNIANVVPVLSQYYQQASEAYEQSATHFVTTIIYYQYGRLFQFAEGVEKLLYTIRPDQVPYQVNYSQAEMRKTVNGSLKGVEKGLRDMYRRMQKQLISEELFPSVWDKLKEVFLDKYENLEGLMIKEACETHEKSGLG